MIDWHCVVFIWNLHRHLLEQKENRNETWKQQCNPYSTIRQGVHLYLDHHHWVLVKFACFFFILCIWVLIVVAESWSNITDCVIAVVESWSNYILICTCVLIMALSLDKICAISDADIRILILLFDFCICSHCGSVSWTFLVLFRMTLFMVCIYHVYCAAISNLGLI